MKIKIVMVNPHDSAHPTQMTCNDCETLDDAVEVVYFYMRHCRIIRIEVIEG